MAIVLSVSTMIVAVSFVNGFQKEIRGKVFSFWGHIHVVPYTLGRSYNESGIYRYPSFVKSKKAYADIAHIQPIVTKAGLIKTPDAFDGTIVRGVDTSFYWKKFKNYLIAGEVLSNDSAARSKQLLISSSTAKRLSIALGDKVLVHFPGQEIQTRAFRIAGIYETGIEEFDKDVAIGDMQLLQSLNRWGSDTVSSFEVFLKDKPLFKNKLKAYGLLFFGGLMPEEMYVRWSEDPLDIITQNFNEEIEELDIEALSVKDIYPGLFDWLELQNMNELIILILMVLVACINMVSALLIFVLERTTMVGLLKSLGASSRSMIGVFLYYGVLVVFLGLLLGDIVGVGLCWLQATYHIIKLPMDSYYIRYAPVSLSFWAVVIINVGTLFFCTLALLLPLRIIKNISPIKAIRFD